MSNHSTSPRVLIVTLEVSYLPEGMDDHAGGMNAKAGGLADVSAALIDALYRQGVDVHVVLPNYRSMFDNHLRPVAKRELTKRRKSIPEERVHLAQDRAFFYSNHVYYEDANNNLKNSLAFQREVINNIVPRVQPDLIHCNDWMTGLIPAMARLLGVPCLFTIHNIHTVKSSLAEIEKSGIDDAAFWRNLYFEQYPSTYEETRDTTPVEFLTSGVFSAHYVNTVSPSFLDEVIDGRHGFVKSCLRKELANKKNAGCAVGILNAPEPSYNPTIDEIQPWMYSPENHVSGKRRSKQRLQQDLGLIPDTEAPVFFWPSRLDPVQKGCQLLADILYDVVSRYWKLNLEIVFVADGVFQRHFRDIVRLHHLSDRVVIHGFNERVARLAYGASDFVLMPSSFEPCGLPQMIGAIYGTLPVAHDTGGLHDTVTHINLSADKGNGFLFETFDQNGLSWAIDQAIQFYLMPADIKERQIRRIMIESAATFNHQVTAQHYIDVYEKMLQRPLLSQRGGEACDIKKNSNQDGIDRPNRKDPTIDRIPIERKEKSSIIHFSKRKSDIEEQQIKIHREENRVSPVLKVDISRGK